MRRRYLATGAVLVGLLTGCSGGGHDPHASGTTTSTTSSSLSPNPDVVPAVITPAYVDAVFRVLEHIDGNASRTLIAAHAVTPKVLADIRAIYNDPLYAQEVKIAQQSLQGSLRNVKTPPGDVRVGVVSLISSSPDCIFVRTADDYTDVLVTPGPAPASGYWGLQRKQPGHDPQGLNPTPWALSFNAVFNTPTSVPNQCAGI